MQTAKDEGTAGFKLLRYGSNSFSAIRRGHLVRSAGEQEESVLATETLQIFVFGMRLKDSTIDVSARQIQRRSPTPPIPSLPL